MKRGFTLIELLAVITVLGLILLIIIPKVTSMLKQSNKTTKEESVEMYGRAIDEAIATYFVKYPDEDNVTLQQLENEHMVKYKGPNVSCKVSHIARRKAHLEKCTVKGELVNYIYGSYATLISDADNDGEISRGDKYSYEVNDKDEFNFYVLSIEGDKVNLIMDRNICESGEATSSSTDACTVAWYETSNDNAKGPITAMTKLYNATKKWINVPSMNLDYDDTQDNINAGYTENTNNGYKGIKITNGVGTITNKTEDSTTPIGNTTEPLKARLPKYEEVYNKDTNDTTHCHSSEGSCPTWLVENIKYYNITYGGISDKYSMNNRSEVNQNIWGYWLLSSDPGNSSYARLVYYNGGVSNYTTAYAFHGGVRPVITVSKSDLS